MHRFWQRKEEDDSMVAQDVERPDISAIRFGAGGGAEISNKDTILAEIDEALGVDKPPAVEYIYVEPYTDVSFFSTLGFSRNPYGHAAVRYTLPDGEQVLMNIAGKGEMVTFLEPADYLYGTDFSLASQGGVYNRTMVSIRLEELPEESVLALHKYYQNLRHRGANKDAKFSLFMFPFWNWLARIVPVQLAERGNCARYTSKGLVESELLPRSVMWPKSIWVDIYKREVQRNPNNVHVVYYQSVKHAIHSYGKSTRFVFAPVAPFNFVDNIVYFDLRRFADVIVEVPEGTTKARITKPDVFTDKISYIVVPLFYALHKAMQVTFHVS